MESAFTLNTKPTASRNVVAVIHHRVRARTIPHTTKGRVCAQVLSQIKSDPLLPWALWPLGLSVSPEVHELS